MNYQIQGLSIHAEVHGTAEPTLVAMYLRLMRIHDLRKIVNEKQTKN